jgi:hypothetical protein
MRHDFGSWTFTASSNNLIGCAGTRRSGAADHHPRRSRQDPSCGQGSRTGRLGNGGSSHRIGRFVPLSAPSARGRTRCLPRSAPVEQEEGRMTQASPQAVRRARRPSSAAPPSAPARVAGPTLSQQAGGHSPVNAARVALHHPLVLLVGPGPQSPKSLCPGPP